jgi:hypothetical protein
VPQLLLLCNEPRDRGILVGDPPLGLVGTAVLVIGATTLGVQLIGQSAALLDQFIDSPVGNGKLVTQRIDGARDRVCPSA